MSSVSKDLIDLATSDVTGTLAVTNGGTGLATATQGDLLYASAANTLSKLAKDTNSTRVLTNTGTSNNPAWAQLDLVTGVTAVGTDWTPSLTVTSGSLSSTSIIYAKHIKIGRLVIIIVSYTVTVATGTPGFIRISNLPYTSASLGNAQKMYGNVNNNGLVESGNVYINDNATTCDVYRAGFAAYTTNPLAGLTANFFYLAAS